MPTDDDDDFDSNLDEIDSGENEGQGDDSEDKPSERLLRTVRRTRRERDELRRELAELKRRQSDGAKADDGAVARAAADREAEARALEKLRPKLVSSVARGALVSAGARADRVGRLVRLLDTDEIDVSESGEVDEDSLSQEVDRLKEEWPELFTTAEADDAAVRPRRPRVDGGRVSKGSKAAGASGSTARLARMLTGGS